MEVAERSIATDLKSVKRLNASRVRIPSSPQEQPLILGAVPIFS